MRKINKKIINSKLSHILEYMEEMAPILKIEVKFLLDKKNYKELRTLERDFQLIVDTMIEINSHLIKNLNLPPADDYTNTFIILGKHKILPSEFAVKIAKVVGLRNKIIHKYDIINAKKFIQDLKENSQQFKKYLKHIKQLLKWKNILKK